jgi:macrophage erythroblast attacher
MREIEQAMSLLFFGQGTNVGIYKVSLVISMGNMIVLSLIPSCHRQRMYDPARWQSLRDQFQTTFNSIYGIPTQPILSLTTSAGMSSLKLAACATGLPHESADGVDVVMESDQTEPHNPTSRALVLSIPSLASSPPIHDDSWTIDPSIPTTSDASPLHTHPDHPQRNVDCPTCAPYVAVLARQVAYSHHTNSSIVCRISGEVIGDESYALAFPNGYVYSHKVGQSKTTICALTYLSTKALSQMAKETVGGIVTCPRTGEQCPFDQLRRVYIL